MPETSRKRPASTPFYIRIWQLLSSPRLTLLVILLLVAVCLVGVFLIQAPSEVTADPASYSSWITSVATPKYGAWTGFLSALRFFDIFHSLWFIVVGTLLMVNILFCTVKRWNAVVNTVRGGEIMQSAVFYRGGTDRAESRISIAPEKASQAVADALKERRFRVRSQGSGSNFNIFARRNRFSPAGTFLTHLSLILFVLGFMVTAFWGFNHAGLAVAEGSKVDVGHGTGLALELTSFQDEYWPNGMPKDFRSNIILYSGENQVAEGLVRVNSPFSYHGINFYQAGFGSAARMQVQTLGSVIFDGVVLLDRTVVNEGVARYSGKFTLSGNVTVMLLSHAYNGADPFIGENETGVYLFNPGQDLPVAADIITMGVPTTIEGVEFTFVSMVKYSVFQVAHSPGILLVWIACGALILGLGLVFYFPYRQLWVLIEPGKAGTSHLTVRGAGRSSPGMNEINALVRRMQG